MEVLKTLGAKGFASVQAELERLETEETQLKRSLADIATRQVPVERVSDDARAFLETWQDIGELLDSATPEERLQILQHDIEVVELGLIDPDTRTGSYAMRLFPEVRPDRGFDLGSGGNGGPDDANPSPETSNGAIPSSGEAPSLLTLDGLVRTTVQKAPPVGFEPTTRRLTGGWSELADPPKHPTFLVVYNIRPGLQGPAFAARIGKELRKSGAFCGRRAERQCALIQSDSHRWVST